MKVSKKFVIVAAALPMVLATSVFAKGGKDMDRPYENKFEQMDRGLIRQLDLTEEQKAQLDEMRKENREQRRAERTENKAERQAQMKAQHAAVQDLVLAENFDAEKAQQLAKQMVEKQTERRVKQLEAQHEMLSVLTPEQKVKLKELQAERMEKMMEKMEHRAEKGNKN